MASDADDPSNMSLYDTVRAAQELERFLGRTGCGRQAEGTEGGRGRRDEPGREMRARRGRRRVDLVLPDMFNDSK